MKNPLSSLTNYFFAKSKSLHTAKIARRFLLPSFILVSAIFLMSCSTEDEIQQDTLPIFGTCEATAASGGILISSADKTITYQTSGGGKILIDQKGMFLVISHRDYSNFKLEFWGTETKSGTNVLAGNHENLNGKHIKDRLTNIRSVVFPDGTKLTMTATSVEGETLKASIYDGTAVHHINLTCGTLEYSVVNSAFAMKLDEKELDGETSTFEITSNGLLFLNIYSEMELGKKVEKRVPLGEIFRNEPSKVVDYFDDPRLAHT